MRGGGIVALAGVDGDGQSELVQAITGILVIHAGPIVAEFRPTPPKRSSASR